MEKHKLELMVDRITYRVEEFLMHTFDGISFIFQIIYSNFW